MIKGKVLFSGSMKAKELMEKDRCLLASIEEKEGPILHLYEWENPSFTYGYFLNPEKFVDLEICSKKGFEWARRPTGGGLIFHLTDFTYSLLFPLSSVFSLTNPLENYQRIHSWVIHLLQTHLKIEGLHLASGLKGGSPNFCLENPSPFDLFQNGKKIGGAAQRLTKIGLLHQGSLTLLFPPERVLEEIIYDGKKKVDQMLIHSDQLRLNELENTLTLNMLRKEIGDLFSKEFFLEMF